MSTMPSSPEAERLLLGAILAGKTPPGDLNTKHFHDEANAAIFAAVSTIEEGEKITPSAVQIALADSGQLAAVGGKEYLAQLAQKGSDPSARELVGLREQLEEKALVREVVQIADSIATQGRGDYGEVSRYILNAASKLNELANRRPAPGLKPLNQVILHSFRKISEQARAGREIAGLSTGFKDLDRITAGLSPGQLILLGARPGMGKTSFALNLAVNACHAHRCFVLIFSLENDADTLQTRMLCSEARVDSQRMRTARLSREDWPQLAQAAGMLSDLPVFIDDTPRLTVSELWERVESLAQRGLGLVVVDYVQLVRPEIRGETREREMTEISRSLKALARHFNVPVVALTQLNRGPEGRKTRDRRPMLSDMRATGALEEDADLVLLLYRDEMYHRETLDQGIAEVIVAKQRFGPTGTIKLRFFDQYSRFDNLIEE